MNLCEKVHIYKYLHVYVHTHTHIFFPKYVYTHIHTHMNTQERILRIPYLLRRKIRIKTDFLLMREI